MSIEKFVGRIVTIIYEDKSGQLTQRCIRIQTVESGKVRAYDLDKRAPRVFDSERILAVRPEGMRA